LKKLRAVVVGFQDIIHQQRCLLRVEAGQADPQLRVLYPNLGAQV